VALDASHLFAPNTTKIGFRRGTFLRQFQYDFIQLFAPHLTAQVVQTAEASESQEALDELFASLELPEY
ncbi:MAG: HTH-type transcriptional regulator CysB, partial [Proteobacteria bacterium]|nr:HTH-type transcriptional regulator CysB [Pseudomonadota bacterium]